ncbi:MAG: ribonuclease HII [Candidatus Omnitrophota bacterium]|jgi:ribonuclease HII
MNDLFAFDRTQGAQEGFLLAGVDEAGRGPLAGPVVAAAVIISRKTDFRYLNDSKQVSPARREELYLEITQNCLVGIGLIDEKIIDEINIYQATRVAMKRAVLALPVTPHLVLIDGPMRLDLAFDQKPVIRGDQKSASIAAASIVAKVTRDTYMTDLEERYPGYGFKKHKGYGTRYHLERIREMGPSPVHRRSFAPIRAFFRQEEVHEALHS